MLGIAPDEIRIEGFAGKKSTAPIYIQFITGYCSDVCHHSENIFHESSNHTNTIMAIPHQTDKNFKTKQNVDGEDRYYPLLRTMHDVPTKGDPVLLTTLGGINYYMGPLNMPTNSPTWNEDKNYSGRDSLVVKTNSGEITPREARGESRNINKVDDYLRLTKKRKESLDGDAPVLNETTGDTMIEGRHGNSLRIGSRSNNPYIFISNGRDSSNEVEQLVDGSLISITTNGTLEQHFDKTALNSNGDAIPFRLSSDLIEGNTYPIGNIYTDLNNGADVEEIIYGYNTNQILFNSDRITLNSKLDDIFISSNKDIHIGAGRHLSISSFDSLNLLSSNINIGNSTRAAEMQSMVLGDMLKEVLTEMVDFFTTATIFTGQLGSQSFQMDPTFATNQPKLNQIKNKIESITSNFHKIEGN